MEDVIFAGSPTKPPLGMAEVELTIDNSARLLPVEFSEVTISRTLFRSGDSEYRMNGSICRLLDISEMLSDAGVGKEQHTIVGQGRLDEVLSADPVQMRNIIEDAAGVGKHRRRKERAIRKIAATETNLEHLGDLLSEIRRQLKPLRQQAEIAERHERIREERDRIRLVVIARQLAALTDELGSPEAGRREEELRVKEQELAALQAELADLEAERLAHLGATAGRREIGWRMTQAGDRLASLKRLAEERARTLKAELTAGNEDVEQARMVELRRQQTELEAALAEAQREEAAELAALNEIQPASERAREELRSAEAALNTALRTQAQVNADAAGLRREISAARATAQSAEMDRKRLAERAEAAEIKRRQSESRIAAAELELDLVVAALRPSEEVMQKAEERLEELGGLKDRLLEEIRNLEKQVAVLRARAGARAAAEAKKTDAGASLRSFPGTSLLSELVELSPGHRRALEVLVGPIDGVVVAPDREAAARALSASDEDEALTVMVAEGSGIGVEGAVPLIDRVQVLDPRARAVLADVYLASTLDEAVTLAGRHRHAIFLSEDGAVAHGGLVSKGSAELASAVLECEGKIAAGREAMADLEGQIAGARARLKEAAAAHREAEASRVRSAEYLRVRQTEGLRVEAEITEITEAARRSAESALTMADQSGSLDGRVEEAEAAVLVAETGSGDCPERAGSVRRRLRRRRPELRGRSNAVRHRRGAHPPVREPLEAGGQRPVRRRRAAERPRRPPGGPPESPEAGKCCRRRLRPAGPAGVGVGRRSQVTARAGAGRRAGDRPPGRGAQGQGHRVDGRAGPDAGTVQAGGPRPQRDAHPTAHPRGDPVGRDAPRPVGNRRKMGPRAGFPGGRGSRRPDGANRCAFRRGLEEAPGQAGAGAGPDGQSQPAGGAGGGVPRRTGGVPGRPDQRREGEPQGPSRDHRVGRRQNPGAVLRRLRGHRPGVHPPVLGAVPRRGRASSASPTQPRSWSPVCR